MYSKNNSKNYINIDNLQKTIVTDNLVKMD